MINSCNRLSVAFACALLALLALGSRPLAISAQVSTPDTTCPGAPATRLAVGATANVMPGSSNNLRDSATIKGKVIGQAQAGDTLSITAGPTCADGYLWWLVNPLTGSAGTTGWVAEGHGTAYFLDPTSTDYQTFTEVNPTSQISYKNVSLTYNHLFGAQVLAETVKDVAASQNDPFDDYPQHILLTFGITQSDKNYYSAPNLSVYNAADITTRKGTDPQTPYPYKPVITALSGLLSSQPDVGTLTDIQIFPLPNAGQVLRAQGKYLTFQGGKALRFVTMYAQDAGSIVNDRLEYMIVGLTDDGKYYVFGRLPISTTVLTDNDKAMPQDFNATNYGDLYTAYVAASIAKINASGDSDFTPKLSDLDALFTSINIK